MRAFDGVMRGLVVLLLAGAACAAQAQAGQLKASAWMGGAVKLQDVQVADDGWLDL